MSDPVWQAAGMNMNGVRAFMRREDYVPKRRPPGRLCEAFVIQCFLCHRYDVRLISQFDEEAGEMSLWLVCGQCPNRERLKVK